jgi:hypothetical protein
MSLLLKFLRRERNESTTLKGLQTPLNGADYDQRVEFEVLANLAEIIDSLDGIGIADCLKKAKLPLH